MRTLFAVIFLWIIISIPAFSAVDGYQKAFDLADKNQFYAALQIAHAKKSQLLVDYLDWRRFKLIDERPEMEALLRFYARHSDWPDTPVLLKRMLEQWALTGADDGEFQDIKAFIAQESTSKFHGISQKNEMIKAIWYDGDYTGIEQEHMLQRYRKLLSRADIAIRVDELLWEKKAGMAQRLLPKLPAGERKLHEARIALMRMARGVSRKIKQVPASLRKSPALQYERLRWRHRKKLSDGVLEILRQAPTVVPHPEKWWYYRAIQVRNAIEAKKYKQALDLLKNHGQVEGAPLADALWLKGWLLLRYMKRPQQAYEAFYAMHKNVSYPVSVSRGAYWAGRAAAKNGNQKIAQNWYREALKHPTTFYGQMAHLALHEGAPLRFNFDDKGNSRQSLKGTAQNQIALIRLLAKYEQDYSAEKFLRNLADRHSSADAYAAVASIAHEIGKPHLAVRTGKYAAQQDHLALAKLSYPTIALQNPPIEPALVMAISRQESEFNPQARSHANAMGMMQLLPSTAKAVARKHDIPYSSAKLFDPAYNMTLGSHYLAALINRYDGRYPLAIAAYNAGPGNVGKWLDRFGQPPKDVDGLIDWLETIPFSETRNYVQRVLENMHVYRHQFKQQPPLTKRTMFGQK